MATQRSGRAPETRNPAPSLVTPIGTSGSAAIVAAGAAAATGRAAPARGTSAPRGYRSPSMRRRGAPGLGALGPEGVQERIHALAGDRRRPVAGQAAPPGRRLGLGQPGPALGQVDLV